MHSHQRPRGCGGSDPKWQRDKEQEEFPAAGAGVGTALVSDTGPQTPKKGNPGH